MKKNITKLLVLALAVMSVMLAFASCGCSHEEKTIPAKEATCTAEGATEGKECAKCGEVLVAPEVLPKLEHTSEEVAKQDATCTEDGHEAGTKCSVCDTVLTGMEKIAAAHTPVDVEAKEATCVETGNTAGTKCSVCQEILTGVETIPTNDNHTFREVPEKAATCLENGTTAGKFCTATGCNYQEGMETITALGHALTEVAKLDPTCTTAGHEAGTICTREGCDHVEAGHAEIPALGHTPDATKTVVLTQPTLGVAGSATGECSVCKAALELVITALPGRVWDYEGEDHGLEIKGSGAAKLKTEMKNEDGRSYVSLSYDVESKGGAGGEWNIFFTPETEHSFATPERTYTFQTDIRFDNIELTDSYKANSNPWMMYSTLTDSDSTSGDNNHIITNLHSKYTEENGLVLTISDKNGKERILPYGEWFTYKVVYTMMETEKMVYATFYVNDIVVYETQVNNIYKDAVILNDPVYAFKFKFKNISNYNSFGISFDNTTFAETDSGYAYCATVDKALEAENNSKVAFMGTVDEVYQAYNSQYDNCSVYVSNGLEGEAEKRILVYRAPGNLNVGDVIYVRGTMSEFNGVKQIAEGNSVVMITDVEASAPVEMTITDALAANVGTAVIIKGTVESIKDAWSDQYGNCSPYIVDEAGNKILVYRCNVNVAVGDKVTVTGYVDQYNGTKQIAQGSTVVVEEPEVVGPIEIGEGIYTGENEIAVTDTIYGTAITITRAGKYTIAPAEGETNADILVNNMPVDAPYSFEVAEGASVTINVVTKDFQAGTVKVVIAEQE